MNLQVREKLDIEKDLARIAAEYIFVPNTLEQARIDVARLIIDRWNLWDEIDILKADKSLSPIAANELRARACTAEARVAQLLKKEDGIKQYILEELERIEKDLGTYSLLIPAILRNLLNKLNEAPKS